MLAFEETSLEGILGIMIPIVAIVGGISLAMATVYLRSKERMEMINKGMDLSKAQLADFPRRKRRSPLRSGFIFFGAGLGLLLAYVLCHSAIIASRPGEDQTVIYLGFVGVFVGLGMILSHLLEKKEPEQ